MTRLSGGEVNVEAGTGFRFATSDALPIVRLTVTDTAGRAITIHLCPLEARAVGLDLIGAAHSAIADTELRGIAQAHGLDGDSLVAGLRTRTYAELGLG